MIIEHSQKYNPASPATIQLLSECGWSVLPALAVLRSAGERHTKNYPQKAHMHTEQVAAERLVFLEE